MCSFVNKNRCVLRYRKQEIEFPFELTCVVQRLTTAIPGRVTIDVVLNIIRSKLIMFSFIAFVR